MNGISRDMDYKFAIKVLSSTRVDTPSMHGNPKKHDYQNQYFYDIARCMAIQALKEKYENDKSKTNAPIVKVEAYKECIEKVKEIIDLIVELMFDDSVSRCQLPNCHKPSSFPCESEICIQENKEYWHGKLDNLLKEMVGVK